MKKPAKKSKKNHLDNKHFVIYTLISVLLLLIVGALLLRLDRLSRENQAYKTIENYGNQACLGVSGKIVGKAQAGFHLDLKANDAPVISYACLIGQTTDAATIQGKYIDAYAMGGQVYYFNSAADAKKYAEQKVNPLRYWGVDTEGQNQGIPQTSKFTFIVTDVDKPFFDAYSVKDNAVIRVSLPCQDSKDIEACYVQANSVLDLMKNQIAQISL